MKPRIIFFGTSEFAIPAFEALCVAGMSPVAVITSPDKPAGRGRKSLMSPIKKIANRRNLILQPLVLDAHFIAQIVALKPDLGIVASYGKILPKALLELFPNGILNIHPSLLPKYRGSSPIQAAILNGDTETGVTIMLVDEKMDHGPILTQTRFRSTTGLNRVWVYQELHDELAKLGAQLLIETIPGWMAGEIKPIPPDEAQATYTQRIKKEDGLIDWSRDVDYIERMVRAYNPWPGTFTILKNGRILKIKKVEITNGKLVLLVVQPEGKKEMSGDAYLRGHPAVLT